MSPNGIGYIVRDSNSVKIFCFPSEKGLTLKEKNPHKGVKL